MSRTQWSDATLVCALQCMLSQLIMHALNHAGGHLVPILIKVQSLQRSLLQFEQIYDAAWNWVDAYIRRQHGADSDLYCMLSQALMARRALLLLDGIDEGGVARDRIEAHITEVLEPQGHIMVATSRPASINLGRFARFEHLKLAPLSEDQQRLGALLIKSA